MAVRNFFLSVIGSGSLVAQQLLFFILVQRWAGIDAAGGLAVAWALTAPLFLLFTSGARLMQLRMGSDRPHSNWTLDSLRVAGGAAAAFISIPIWTLGFRHSTTALMLAAVLLQRIVDVACERDYSILQASGLAAQAGTVLTTRSVVQAIVGTLCLASGIGVVSAVALVAAFGAFAHLMQRRRISAVPRFRWGSADRQLLTSCLALGAAGALASAAINGPRLAISRFDSSLATGFSNLILPFTLVSLASTALGVVYLPQLGQQASRGVHSALRMVENRMLSISALIATFGAGVSLTSSLLVIPLIIGDEMKVTGINALLASSALMVSVLASTLQDILTGRGNTALQPLAFGSAAVCGTFVTAQFGGNIGVTGAVLGLLIGTAIQAMILLAGAMRSRARV